jgi:site-specific DNA recombinase
MQHYARRASHFSDRLLAQLITCTHCGKRYIGTAAQGNKCRCRDHIYFSRHRYDSAAHSDEWLPADRLESGVCGLLQRTILHHDLFYAALAAGLARSGDKRRRDYDESGAIVVESAMAEEAIERYFLTSEAGTLSETPCGQRVQTFAGKIAALEARHSELASLLDAERETTVTQPHLDRLHCHVVDTTEQGDLEAQMGLHQALLLALRSKVARQCARTSGHHLTKVA